MKAAGASPQMRRTSDYVSMVDLGRRSGLEISCITNALVAYGFYAGDELVGCAYLQEKSGTFMVECLAVDDRMRRRGLGSALVRKIEDEARGRGAKKLWAVARHPAFFERNGYRRKLDSEADGPTLSNCADCIQYGRGCNPAVTVKDL